MEGDEYVGLLSFCSFIFSVIAAVLAIDLYALLRTGRSGATWRVLIIASVMFALMHALRLAELLNFGLFRLTHLSEIVELMFVMALAYAFYLQRKTFSPHDRAAAPRSKPKPEPRAASREDIAASSKPPAEPSPDTLDTDLNQSQTLAADSTRDAELEDEDLEDEDEEAASEWARLNGQADGVAPRRAQRVGE